MASAPTPDLLGPLEKAIAERFRVEDPGCFPSSDGRLRRTARSADFDQLMTRMREVLDYDPEAVW